MRVHALPAFDDNYIWMLADHDGRAIVVDPGDAGPVLRAAAEGLRPEAILLTHHHDDHVGGVGALLARWPGLAVHAPEDARIPQATVRVHDGDVLHVPGHAVSVLAVPGHTRSHVAYVLDADGDAPLLACGDTLFSLGCGRLFEGTPAQMLASLDRMAALPDATTVLCGHEYTEANARFARAVEPGNAALQARTAEVQSLRGRGLPTLPTRMDQERACNPFLRVDQPEVVASIAARLGHPPGDRVAAFAALRAWKDGFRG